MSSTERSRGPEAVAASPWEVLGLEVEAGPEAVREAYLRKVKEHPPDRSPVEFERVRDAYEQLRDRRSRARMLLQVNPSEPFVNLVAQEQPVRRHAGKDLWMKLIRGG